MAAQGDEKKDLKLMLFERAKRSYELFYRYNDASDAEAAEDAHSILFEYMHFIQEAGLEREYLIWRFGLVAGYTYDVMAEWRGDMGV